MHPGHRKRAPREDSQPSRYVSHHFWMSDTSDPGMAKLRNRSGGSSNGNNSNSNGRLRSNSQSSDNTTSASWQMFSTSSSSSSEASPPTSAAASSSLEQRSSSTTTRRSDDASSTVDLSVHIGNNNINTNTNNANNRLVPADQERQIMLLMLLAQVCAWTDPTPRTFTVHVLELFERGILDRESIVFLFELGLVPKQSSPTTAATASHPLRLLSNGGGGKESDNDDDWALAPMAAAQRRGLEASAIRSLLEEQEAADDAAAAASPSSSSPNSPPTTTRWSSWSAKHYPLHLSRFQREFTRVGWIARGGFGAVHKCRHHLDGQLYAVKSVPFQAQGFDYQIVHQQILPEIIGLGQCQSPHVVRYYTSWLEPSWMTGTATSGDDNNDEDDSDNSSDNNSDDDDDIDEVGGSRENWRKPVRRRNPKRKSSLKLLTDIQRVVNRESPSDILKASNGSFWDDDHPKNSSSQWLEDSTSPRHRRRSSFDVSERFFDYGNSSGRILYHNHNDDDEDDNNNDDDSLFDRSCHSNRDDLYVGTKWEPSSHKQSTTTPSFYQASQRTRQRRKRSPSYRYQICLYIQMELCHRDTLADWIREANRSQKDDNDRVRRAIPIFHQICQGLAHVHAQSIVHRDMKPANIFRDVDDSRIYKIGDFGLSKRLESLRTSPKSRGRPLLLTAAASAVNNNDASDDRDPLTAGVGTASYAAPEQVASTSYGKQADVFSLGLILLELLCPFGTEHERIMTFRDVRQHRRLPTDCRVLDQHPALADIVLRCTHADPDLRPTARELCNLEEVQPFLPMSTTSQHHEETDRSDRIAELEAKVRSQEQELERLRRLLSTRDCRIQELQEELASTRQKDHQARIEIPSRFLRRPSVDLIEDTSLASQTTTSSEEGL